MFFLNGRRLIWVFYFKFCHITITKKPSYTQNSKKKNGHLTIEKYKEAVILNSSYFCNKFSFMNKFLNYLHFLHFTTLHMKLHHGSVLAWSFMVSNVNSPDKCLLYSLTLPTLPPIILPTHIHVLCVSKSLSMKVCLPFWTWFDSLISTRIVPLFCSLSVFKNKQTKKMINLSAQCWRT